METLLDLVIHNHNNRLGTIDVVTISKVSKTMEKCVDVYWEYQYNTQFKKEPLINTKLQHRFLLLGPCIYCDTYTNIRNVFNTHTPKPYTCEDCMKKHHLIGYRFLIKILKKQALVNGLPYIILDGNKDTFKYRYYNKHMIFEHILTQGCMYFKGYRNFLRNISS